jgi:hypothetical protein
MYTMRSSDRTIPWSLRYISELAIPHTEAHEYVKKQFVTHADETGWKEVHRSLRNSSPRLGRTVSVETSRWRSRPIQDASLTSTLHLSHLPFGDGHVCREPM